MSRAKFALGVPLALAASVVEFSMLRRAKPHPVGLASVPPELSPLLESHGWYHGLTDVVLAYGYPFDVTKPLVEVATCFSEAYCELPPVELALARAEHRDAAWARGDFEDPVIVFSAPGSLPEDVPVLEPDFARQERVVAVGGERQVMTVVSLRRYQGLHFRHGSVLVSAVARLGFSDELSFQHVHDLEPFFAGRRRFVLSWLRPWQR
jgi:hypothetical protein